MKARTKQTEHFQMAVGNRAMPSRATDEKSSQGVLSSERDGAFTGVPGSVRQSSFSLCHDVPSEDNFYKRIHRCSFSKIVCHFLRFSRYREVLRGDLGTYLQLDLPSAASEAADHQPLQRDPRCSPLLAQAKCHLRRSLESGTSYQLPGDPVCSDQLSAGYSLPG